MSIPWKKFKTHRRGLISLWIFGLLFAITCGVDLLCNSKPLLIFYKDQWYFPLWNRYSELQFGGEMDLEMEYQSPEFENLLHKNKGWALWPPIPYDASTVNQNLTVSAPAPPSRDNLLGTDDQGRDVLTRLLYGLRTSLLLGITLALGSSVIGIMAGAIQGYMGGWVDLVFQRIIEIWSGLPTLFIMMIFSSLVQPTVLSLLSIMMLFTWTRLVGMVRAEFLRARNYTYVRAAQVLGVRPLTIMVRHILPNAMTSTISAFPFLVSSSISMLTALDFLGFGLPPGSASLGELLQQAKANLYAPWLGLTAFFSISILLMLVTFIGEGFRDAFDPQFTRRT